MLLSEVLYIVKNIHKMLLNESLKSTTLTSLFKPFEYSNLTLDAKKKDSWRATDDGASFFDITRDYHWLARDNELTPELCDTVEGRNKVIKCTYTKKKKFTNYDGRIINGFISKLLKMISEKTGHNIGLSEITDSNLIKISPSDAKKKIYKSGLLFWTDYNDELKAITIDNTIVLYIDKKSEYSSWYEPNPSYNEKTDYSEFYTNEEKVEEFVKKAFKIIPTYELAYDNVNIKNKLGTNNIKALQAVPGIYAVYVVNDNGMSNSNYTLKLQDRREYKKFLKEQLDIAEKNIKRYLDTIALRKSRGIDSKILEKVNTFLDTSFLAVTDLQDLELSKINSTEDKDFSITGESWGHTVNASTTIGYRILLIFGTENNGYRFYETSVRNRYGKGHHKEYRFNIDTICDCFLIINVYINLCIEYANNVLTKYQSYIKIKESANPDPDKVLDELNYMRSSYNGLLNIVLANDELLGTGIALLDDKNIKVDYIINKILKFRFNI